MLDDLGSVIHELALNRSGVFYNVVHLYQIKDLRFGCSDHQLVEQQFVFVVNSYILLQFKTNKLLLSNSARHLKAINLVLRREVDEDIVATYPQLLQLSGEFTHSGINLLIAFGHRGAFLQDAEYRDVFIGLYVHEHIGFEEHAGWARWQVARLQDMLASFV